ncbi:MAG: hypothetical protein JWN76_3042 [Chitinophagaceae bacterium]|nr:hypothetical protein [Chitinophagaceae bacterium]
MKWKTIAYCLIFQIVVSANVFSQEIVRDLKEAENLEIRLDEAAALAKYTQLASQYPDNKTALIKASLLNSNIGARQKDKALKSSFFSAAQSFAQKALALNANDADANYAMAVFFNSQAELETENKKIAEAFRQMYEYALKAVTADPNHARANFIFGKWHQQAADLSLMKKAVAKLAFGGLPLVSLDSAIVYMEKCRLLDQYYVLNYLELAKIYKAIHRPEKALEVLNKLVRLPNRTPDDAMLKQQGQQLLNEIQ